MTSQPELEALYAEATQALKARDYDRASGLLKQILIIDENYKDASRLLAQAVKLRRRRWYNQPLLWGGFGGSIVIFLLAWFASGWNWSGFVSELMDAETSTPAPTETSAGATTPTLIPTPLPVSWKRLYVGQELARDSITAIAVDPLDTDVIYAGTRHAGIYKSIDGGLSWQPAQNGLVRSEVSSLIVDPENPRILFAGVILGGVYKTKDGAQTWEPANNNIEIPGGPFLSTVAMDPADPNHLYYTNSLGLFESTNGGESWKKIQMPHCPVLITSMVMPPTAPNTIYLADREESSECKLGIYRSRDGGATWDAMLLQQVSYLQLQYGSLAVWPEPDERIFVSGRAGEDQRLLRTTDRGTSWERILDQVCDATLIGHGPSGRVYCADRGTNQLMLSEDWGETWVSIFDNDTIREMTVLPHSDSTLIAGSDGSGVLISSDGGATWSKRSNGLGGTEVLLHISPHDENTLFAEDGTTFYRSVDGGHSWSPLTVHGRRLTFDADGKTLYALSDVVLMSEDDGQTWREMTKTNQTISTITAHPQLPNMVIAIHNSGFSVSYDRGQKWDQTNNVVWRSETEEIVGTITTSIFPDRIGRHFYVLINGETTGKVFHLDSSTGVWNTCPLPMDSLTTINLLTIDPRDHLKIILASPGNGLLVSADGCQTWKSSNTGLGSLFVNSLIMDPVDPDILYAGTDGGAYVSHDGGATWAQANDGLLGATVVYSIVVDKDSNVYAATPYGIFKLENK